MVDHPWHTPEFDRFSCIGQGAERPVRLPGELERFQGLPMRVVFAEVAVTGAPAADKARPWLWRTGLHF